ncbi:MAG: hypothetical protein N2114_06465 [Candidatus Goldbacteria bacterium]|nr:hypothetical protein [Candidatus Goldiibacteriota bacterium]
MSEVVINKIEDIKEIKKLMDKNIIKTTDEWSKFIITEDCFIAVKIKNNELKINEDLINEDLTTKTEINLNETQYDTKVKIDIRLLKKALKYLNNQDEITIMSKTDYPLFISQENIKIFIAPRVYD